MELATDVNARNRRAVEIVVGAATWGAITAPLWAAVFIPHVWVYVFLAFSFYWLYRSASLALYAVIAYGRLCSSQSRDWLAECRRLPSWQNVHHLVVVPTHREPAQLLIETLEHLDAQDFPHSQISVVLAFEERDSQALENARYLLNRFRGRFAHLWTTIHPALSSEPPGKASNLAYAVPRAREWLTRAGYRDAERVLVTVCDADSRLHPRHLSALTHARLTDPHGSHCLYQPAMIFHANIERIPPLLRAMDGLYSIIQMARLVSTYKLVTQSTYSLTLAACEAIGYWDPEVVPEDSHTYFKMFFTWGESTHVHPIYLPVLADAAEGTTPWKTVVSHYRQARRWSWGVSDVPYVLLQSLARQHIGWAPRLLTFAHYTKEHLLWPSHWFLLAFGLKLIPFVGPPAALSATHLEMIELSSALILASTPLLLFPMWIDRRLRDDLGSSLPNRSSWPEVLSWLALPALGLVLMVLPALDAHTRLLLGRRLGYDVTEKLVRRRPQEVPLSPTVSLADPRVA